MEILPPPEWCRSRPSFFTAATQYRSPVAVSTWRLPSMLRSDLPLKYSRAPLFEAWAKAIHAGPSCVWPVMSSM
jgi:hypothetical protein